jgi:hypothetical protein
MIKKFNKPGFGLLVAALSVAAIAIQDGINLKRTVKVGDTVKLRLKADVDIQGTEAAFSSLITEKITKVESNGNYTLESSQSEGKVNLGGQEMDVPGSTQTSTYKATGEVMEIKAENVDGNFYRTAHLTSFIVGDKAVKSGDSWAVEIKKDEKTGAVAAKGTFKIEGEEKIGERDTFKIKHSIKETDGGEAAASVEATSWISKKDGTIVKSEGQWKNVPIPGAPFPVSAKYVMTREDK